MTDEEVSKATDRIVQTVCEGFRRDLAEIMSRNKRKPKRRNHAS